MQGGFVLYYWCGHAVSFLIMGVNIQKIGQSLLGLFFVSFQFQMVQESEKGGLSSLGVLSGGPGPCFGSDPCNLFRFCFPTHLGTTCLSGKKTLWHPSLDLEAGFGAQSS